MPNTGAKRRAQQIPEKVGSDITAANTSIATECTTPVGNEKKTSADNSSSSRHVSKKSASSAGKSTKKGTARKGGSAAKARANNSRANSSPVEVDDEPQDDNDPNKLWCICRQPHNNRFMICCDACEEWFHGTCVKVTEVMGIEMEQNGIDWKCPICTKKEMEKLILGRFQFQSSAGKSTKKGAARKGGSAAKARANKSRSNSSRVEVDDEPQDDNDPNKLWCICRQPHNNRFMICCDACEEWFHGTCVKVTEVMGIEMEQNGIDWKCPICTKKEMEKLILGRFQFQSSAGKSTKKGAARKGGSAAKARANKSRSNSSRVEVDDEPQDDNDPNKLWCICRQPYNYRFMICCDACEEWFHGTCIKVTEVMGIEMEQNGIDWKCPICTKKEMEKRSAQQEPKSIIQLAISNTPSTLSTQLFGNSPCTEGVHTPKSTLLTRAEPVKVQRGNGRVITLPPIEMPNTGAKRRAQQIPEKVGSDITAPNTSTATECTTPVGHEKKTSAANSSSSRRVSKKSASSAGKSTKKGAARKGGSAAKARANNSRSNSSRVEVDDEPQDDNDPNKLWCICRQPHNNRFMICCDACEEWFHGKCVKVTEVMGIEMEQNGIDWKCPICTKKEMEKLILGRFQFQSSAGKSIKKGAARKGGSAAKARANNSRAKSSRVEVDDEPQDDNDPNKLWCICRQPHNNRFMICCDACEEWFHGTCVKVTQVVGIEMKQNGIDWKCPICTIKEMEKVILSRFQFQSSAGKSTKKGAARKGGSAAKARANNSRANSSPVEVDDEPQDDNDPNKLWCICRQPHNNRFMICCDACEEWFHGTCVKVTQVVGIEMKQNGIDWKCPICTIKEMEKVILSRFQFQSSAGKSTKKGAARKGGSAAKARANNSRANSSPVEVDDEPQDDNDPNKLWCICRQPHNNRFMICCDACEEWFHGTCVKVTQVVGIEMKQNGIDWKCPICTIKEMEKVILSRFQFQSSAGKSTKKGAARKGGSAAKARANNSRANSSPVEVDDEPQDDNDPNKLWCICRQPYNNRFMICCDACEEWFHGTCIKVTEVMGIEMEQNGIDWKCPICTKKEMEKRQPKITDMLNTKKAAEHNETIVEKDKGPVVVTLEPQLSGGSQPVITTKKSLIEQKKVQSAGFAPVAKVVIPKVPCVLCKKEARPNSVYCSDECIRKYTQTCLNSLAAKQTADTLGGLPGSGADDRQKKKAKRLLFEEILSAADRFKRVSVFDRKKNVLLTGSNAPTTLNIRKWLHDNPTYEIVLPGSPLMNEIEKKEKLNNSQTPQPPSQLKKITSPGGPQSPKIFMQKSQPSLLQKSDEKSRSEGNVLKTVAKPTTGYQQKHTPLNLNESISKKPPQKQLQASTSTGAGTVHEKSAKTDVKEQVNKSKEKALKRQSSESNRKKDAEAFRKNVRRNLKDLLQLRTKEATEQNDGKDIPLLTTEEIEEFVEATEMEMYKYFNGDCGMRYKAKFRAFMFNLSDRKNQTLFLKICAKEVDPKHFVTMSHDELASKELARWRENETKHQLEMIKNSELVMLSCAKNYVLKTHKGEEIIEGKPEDQINLDLTTPMEDVVSLLNISTGNNLSELNESTESSSQRKANIADTDVAHSSADKDTEVEKQLMFLKQLKLIKRIPVEKHRSNKDKEKERDKEHDRSHSRSREHEKSHKSKESKDKYHHHHHHQSEKSRSTKHSRSRSHSTERKRHKSYHKDERSRREKETDHNNKERSMEREQKSDEDKHRKKSSHSASTKTQHEKSRSGVAVVDSAKKLPVIKPLDTTSFNLVDQILDSTKTVEEAANLTIGKDKEKVKQTIIDSKSPPTTATSTSTLVTAPTVPIQTTTITPAPAQAQSATITVVPIQTLTTTTAIAPIPAQTPTATTIAPIPTNDEDKNTINLVESFQKLKISAPKSHELFKKSGQSFSDSLWTGRINMSKISSFYIELLPFVGNSVNLGKLLPQALDVVGRIEAQTVWDYLSKIKKTPNKEIVLIRLVPLNETENSSYSVLFQYLENRNRLGVIKKSSSQLKDFYIFPLCAGQKLPQLLHPEQRVDFYENPYRPDILVGIIVRVIGKRSTTSSTHSTQAGSSSSIKFSRKMIENTGSFTPPGSPKRKKRHHVEREADTEIDVDAIIKAPIVAKMKKASAVAATEVTEIIDDADQPYSPGGGSSDGEKTPPANPAVTSFNEGNPNNKHKLEELDRQIAKAEMDLSRFAVANSSFIDIKIPSDLPQILASIPPPPIPPPIMAPINLPQPVAIDEEYVPQAVSITKPYGGINELYNRTIEKPSTSRLAQLSEAELLSMVPDDMIEKTATEATTTPAATATTIQAAATVREEEPPTPGVETN